MSQSEHRILKAMVSLHTLADGSVDIIATGRNGTLSLRIAGEEPQMFIPNHARGLTEYKGAWMLKANGHLRGCLVDEGDRLQWFPARKQRKAVEVAHPPESPFKKRE